MKLCVGAVSRRVVEVAAELQVHQIVPSRAQVDTDGGYLRWTQDDLVTRVRRFSHGRTEVVRDHGGPRQGGHDDDGVDSFRADVAAGFDGLHVDVCKLPATAQVATLVGLVERFGQRPGAPRIEVGGEHEDQEWNDLLLEAVLRETRVTPSYAVLATGAYVWADSQVGFVSPPTDVVAAAQEYARRDVKAKAHNFDWVGGRKLYVSILEAYNLAPELARVETDALLTVLSWADADRLLTLAYDSGAWRRWFNDGEGTYDARARCAVHYVQETDEVRELVGSLDIEREGYVRRMIANAVRLG